MRLFMSVWVLALGLMACGGDKDSGETGSEPVSGACELLGEWESCPACYDGEVTCSYGDESVTEGSCGDCQARVSLYGQLCDGGVSDSRDDIEAGVSCSDPEKIDRVVGVLENHRLLQHHGGFARLDGREADSLHLWGVVPGGTVLTPSLFALVLLHGSAAAEEPASGPSTLIAPGTPKAQSSGDLLGSFRRVVVAGDIALNIHGDASVATSKIECSTKKGPGILLDIQEDTLMVTPLHTDSRTGGRCLLTLRASTVEHIELSGASRVRGGALAGLSEVEVGGAASLDLRGLSVSRFSLNISGAGKARLSGKVDHLEVVVAGAANIDAIDVLASTGTLTTLGTGNISATIQATVDATSTGVGTITIHGSPGTVNETVDGLGRVVVVVK
jgi:hypothetical protein